MAVKHGSQQFKPNATVAAVIHCHGKFLFVEEYETTQTQQKKVLNQPAGHLEKGENIIAACEREVFEETGLQLSPDYINGIYYFYREDLSLYFLRFCFVIELESCRLAQPQDADIIDTKWLSYEEITQQKNKLRSAMVLECIDDYLENKKRNIKIPLSSLKSNL